jgi:hypothetical protein
LLLVVSGGLLLVVSHLFVVPILVSWVDLKRCKQLNLDVRNSFGFMGGFGK